VLLPPEAAAMVALNQQNLSQGPFTHLRDLIDLRHEAGKVDLTSLAKTSNPLSGQLRSKSQGRGIDFSEVRVYQPGDDVRTIDWRVTARTQVAHTKLFQEEKERPVLIVVDQSNHMFFGSRTRFKSVAAARIAALLAWSSLEQGDRVGGIVFSDAAHREIRPRRSRHSVLRLIHEIDRYNHELENAQPARVTDALAQALVNARRVCKHGSSIILISDFSCLDEQALLYLQQLARYNDVTGIHISDPLEHQLPAPDLYTVTDGERKLPIDTAAVSIREQYQSQYKKRQAELVQTFARLKCLLISMLTTDEVVTGINASRHRGNR
jgi:uncharacterized protein (DUF58 family)